MTHPAIRKGGTAVITGGASGIGLAAAKRFAEHGMNLVLADLNPQALVRARDSLSGFEVEILTVPTDVADIVAVQALEAAAYDRFGAVDVLMNNAGAAPGGGPFDSYDRWQHVLGVNLWGVINGVQTFALDMIAQETPAAIINTGSKNGITGPPGDTAYNVSKAGVKTVTEGLAHSLATTEGCQVTAHLLIPGYVWTGMTRRSGAKEKPPGAWTAEQTIDHMLARLAEGDFYILCPDNDVTPEMDRKRFAWAVGDVTENRPALSRWRSEFKDAFERHMAEGEGG